MLEFCSMCKRGSASSKCAKRCVLASLGGEICTQCPEASCEDLAGVHSVSGFLSRLSRCEHCGYLICCVLP